jgi:hypothetical protein
MKVPTMKMLFLRNMGKKQYGTQKPIGTMKKKKIISSKSEIYIKKK